MELNGDIIGEICWREMQIQLCIHSFICATSMNEPHGLHSDFFSKPPTQTEMGLRDCSDTLKYVNNNTLLDDSTLPFPYSAHPISIHSPLSPSTLIMTSAHAESEWLVCFVCFPHTIPTIQTLFYCLAPRVTVIRNLCFLGWIWMINREDIDWLIRQVLFILAFVSVPGCTTSNLPLFL